MKKAFNKIFRLVSLGFIGCFIFFNSGCGLDSVLVVKEPYVTKTNSDLSSMNSDPLNRYVSFVSRGQSVDGGKYLGTDVYYKIYSSSSDATSEKSTLIALSNSSSTSGSSADRMIVTYKYQILGSSASNQSPVFQNHDTPIYIRLNHGVEASPDYTSPACIKEGGTYPDGVTFGTAVPLRALASDNNKEYGFDFGRSIKYGTPATEVKVPASGDSDAKISGENNSEYWVVMFAVSKAQDTTFTNYYSNIVFLGDFKIISNSSDN